ncbi:MAG: hypothetical protein R3263_13280, partial [Myxococcota bacterium]|nr:hypothetical protein [Myxococcota bacterium]
MTRRLGARHAVVGAVALAVAAGLLVLALRGDEAPPAAPPDATARPPGAGEGAGATRPADAGEG